MPLFSLPATHLGATSPRLRVGGEQIGQSGKHQEVLLVLGAGVGLLLQQRDEQCLVVGVHQCGAALRQFAEHLLGGREEVGGGELSPFSAGLVAEQRLFAAGRCRQRKCDGEGGGRFV